MEHTFFLASCNGGFDHANLGNGWNGRLVAMRPKVPGDVTRFVEESQGQKAGWLGPVYDPFIIDEDPNHPDYRVGSLALDAETPDDRVRKRAELLAAVDRLATDDPVLAAKRTNDRRRPPRSGVLATSCR